MRRIQEGADGEALTEIASANLPTMPLSPLFIIIILLTTACSSASPCTDDADCSFNGICGPIDAACVCDPGWEGTRCGQLRLGAATALKLGDGLGDDGLAELDDVSGAENGAAHSPSPSSPSSPQPPPRSGVAPRRAWTWGGSPVFDPSSGLYHVFYASMTRGCGLLHYQTNSIVRHAVSSTVAGPWRVLASPALTPRKDLSGAGRDVYWDSGAIHGPEVQYDPSTGVWLLFYMGTRYAKASPDCRADPAAAVIDVSPSRRVGLAWSRSIAEGEEHWTRVGTSSRASPEASPVASPGAGKEGEEGQPILSPRPGKWDASDVSNAAPLVFANGSVLLGYRGGGDGVALGGGIGIAFADHWNGSASVHAANATSSPTSAPISAPGSTSAAAIATAAAIAAAAATATAAPASTTTNAAAAAWSSPFKRRPGADGMVFSAEDANLWQDGRGHFHILVSRTCRA